MVKGISRQVILVDSADPKLFEQAIFILKEGHEGVSDEALLREAGHLINHPSRQKKGKLWLYGPVWAAGGALLTGLMWLVSVLI